jgi:hypothetical protein
MSFHERRLPVHHHSVTVGIEELIIAVIRHRFGKVREVGHFRRSFCSTENAEDELSLNRVLDKRGDEVMMSARGCVLACAVTFEIKFIPRRAVCKQGTNAFNMPLVTRFHQWCYPVAVSMTGVDVVGEKGFDGFYVTRLCRASQPPFSAARCHPDTAR